MLPSCRSPLCRLTFESCQRLSHLPQCDRSLLHVLQGHHSLCWGQIFLQCNYILLQLTADKMKIKCFYNKWVHFHDCEPLIAGVRITSIILFTPTAAGWPNSAIFVKLMQWNRTCKDDIGLWQIEMEKKGPIITSHHKYFNYVAPFFLPILDLSSTLPTISRSLLRQALLANHSNVSAWQKPSPQHRDVLNDNILFIIITEVL